MNRFVYNKKLKELYQMEVYSNFTIVAAYHDDGGGHPETFIDYECAFAADMIRRIQPAEVLDVGSYRNFIQGLASCCNVTSVDVRAREATVVGETCLVCDAKLLPIEHSMFDAVVSLCSLEHFGLGRYGDEFDLGADKKAFNEMIRVLKPGGYLVFSTTIAVKPYLCFNAHRIYSHDMIRSFCHGLKLVEEKIHRRGEIGFAPIGSQTDGYAGWDIYLGCWQK